VATRAISERRREELVLAAYRQIAEHGFEGLRTREVAAEVGVNIATLHYYFPTKEALIGAVLAHAMGRFRTTLSPHGSPSEQLRNYLRSVRKLLADEPELGRAARGGDQARVLTGQAHGEGAVHVDRRHDVSVDLADEPELGAVMAELALRSVRDDSIGSIMNQMYDVWLTTMRGLLRRAVKAGALRPELDSDAVAALIVSTLTAMTLPVMNDGKRGDLALRQLERWLGIGSSKA